MGLIAASQQHSCSIRGCCLLGAGMPVGNGFGLAAFDRFSRTIVCQSVEPLCSISLPMPPIMTRCSAPVVEMRRDRPPFVLGSKSTAVFKAQQRAQHRCTPRTPPLSPHFPSQTSMQCLSPTHTVLMSLQKRNQPTGNVRCMYL